MTSACTRSLRPSPSLSIGVSTHTSWRIQSFLFVENTGWAMPFSKTGPTAAFAVAGAGLAATPVRVAVTARPSAAAAPRADRRLRRAVGAAGPVVRRGMDIGKLSPSDQAPGAGDRPRAKVKGP
ncbi:hypothetical protein GCM10023193_52310 [Planotetraspora kaengkrachanensis]|uniref:Uncharacterized protein n=1 Tax=Planotetraspora kaengkrachanensis TaxID=575193 RepID=A0A8J3LW16_9ACTN|nr:hypothetical protein Pka01_25740 [Planotetraspora kaengkrachanensis]